MVKNIIFFLLTRRSVWPLIRMTARRARKTRMFIEIITDTRLRIQFKLPFFRDDESLDEQLSRVRDNYFNWSGEGKKPLASAKERTYAEWLLNDSSSNSDREIYFFYLIGSVR